MREEGYDVEVVQDVSSDLLCVICLKLMRNPVQFKCGHGMCFNCHRHLLSKTNKNKGVKDLQCPQCREVIRENQVFSNVMLHRLILSLQIYCSNEDSGCRWVGEVSQLEDHLLQCSRNSAVSVASASGLNNLVRKTRKRAASGTIQDTLQNSMMLNMIESLSSLRSKIDTMEDNLAVQQSSPEKHTSCSSCNVSVPSTRKRSRRHENRLVRWKQYLFDSENQELYLKICFLVALVSIYLMTAKLFTTFEAPIDSGVTQSSCDNHVIDNAVTKKLNEQVQEYKNGFHHLNQMLAYNQRIHLHELQSDESRATSIVPSFYREQNRTIVEMDRRILWMIEQSRQDINQNISRFDQHSLAEYSINDVSSLRSTADNIFNALWRRAFEEINFKEFHLLQRAGNVYELARHSFLEVRERAAYSAREITEENTFSKVKKMEYKELVQNVTHRIQMLNQQQIERVVAEDFTRVRSFYEHNLRAFHSNVSRSTTHESRLWFLVEKIQNLNLKNGRFIWHVNMTAVLKVGPREKFHSDEFQSGSAGNAKLYLYRDRARPGFWKLTFVQREDSSVKIWLSILSQRKPELLLSFENAIGAVLPVTKSKRKKVKVVKHFSIPLNSTDMEKQGYIRNGNMYIRCITTD